MHELAIADSVVRIASAHAAGRRVAKVELKVGHLRQVVPSALEFAFGLVAEGTEVEGAELVLDTVRGGGGGGGAGRGAGRGPVPGVRGGHPAARVPAALRGVRGLRRGGAPGRGA